MNKKIAYCTPSLYIPGGIERVLTTKANYFAEVLGYDIYIILTDGKGKKPYYELSPKIHIIQLDVNFEELWNQPFWKKAMLYLEKQRIFKKRLKETLFQIRPDVTVTLLRREINFITDIKDGSKKIGELHVNRLNYRNFEANETNMLKDCFSKLWMKSLIKHLKKLDRLIVLTKEDQANWNELNNTCVIPNPLSFETSNQNRLNEKQVIAVGRYTYQKGFDLLLKAWQIVAQGHPDWRLKIYGAGNRLPYQKQIKELGIENNCFLEESTSHIIEKYNESSIFALSSRFEGFGMVIAEAMSCGIPCVSFDCPCGPKEIIRNSVDGFIVTLGDYKDLAAKIQILIEDEERRKKMGEEAFNNIQRYSMQNISKKWECLFKDLMTE